MVATADEVGRVLIGSPTIAYRPVTTYVPRRTVVEENGKPLERTTFEAITSYQLERTSVLMFGVDELRAMTVDGKSIESAKLLETLRAKPTAVVFAPDGIPLDSLFADLLKPGTIVLIPMAKEPPRVIVPPPTVAR